MRRLQIAQAVADHGHAVQVDAESRSDLGEHSGLWLAAIAIRVRGMRAIEHRIDAPAHLQERFEHLVVDRGQRRHAEKAAADARLIGRDDDAIARLVQSRDRFEAAGNRPPLVGRFDELLAVVIDHAIAIEDDQAQRAMSAVRVGCQLDHNELRGRIVRRRASRCRRPDSSASRASSTARDDWRAASDRRR